MTPYSKSGPRCAVSKWNYSTHPATRTFDYNATLLGFATEANEEGACVVAVVQKDDGHIEVPLATMVQVLDEIPAPSPNGH